MCARALQDELYDLFDLLVGDYNFVLDPRPQSRNLILSGVGVVIDEAHNVYERVREELSARATAASAWRALEDRAEIAELARAFLSELPALPDEAPACDYGALLPVARRSLALLAATAPRAAGRPFLEELASIAWALEDADNPRSGFADREGVHLACLDPAPFIASRLESVDPLVLLSATLDPPDLHLARIGLPEVEARIVDDPFASQRQVVLVPVAGSLWEEREREAPNAAAAMAALVKAHPGRYLAFACSYDHVALVSGALEGTDLHVVPQLRGMDRLEVETLARDFCSGPEPAVLIAPAAGLLGEGVDLPPGLSGVFLLGPALPALTAERRAIQRYHDANGDNGFALAFLVPGLARVVQAAGRVVRREGEHAFIILLDRRFGRRQYRALLPKAWQTARPLSLARAIDVLARGRADTFDEAGWED
ncbi:MAG: helicase C-terminal domain-containing protein [Acidobacteriota bacterium]